MKKIFSCIAAVWMLASCDPVTDPVKATGIEIRPSSVTLEIGKTDRKNGRTDVCGFAGAGGSESSLGKFE